MGNKVQCIRPSPEKVLHVPLNRFKVYNVSETGRVVKGYLEVTNTDLIFHVLNAEPVRWPLRCLRRYGYDAKHFSFESGRRCATGPGIYAFKGKHASQIFHLVQENAHRTQDNGATPTTTTTTTNGLSAIRQRSLSSDAAPSAFSPTSIVVSRSSSHASGMNGSLPGHAAASPVSPNPPTSPSPLYFNQSTGSLGNGSLRLSPVSPTIQYVNTSTIGDIPESPLEDAAFTNGDIPGDMDSHNVSRDSFGDPSLNYARLKLPSDEDRNTGEDTLRNLDNCVEHTNDDGEDDDGDDDDGDKAEDGDIPHSDVEKDTDERKDDEGNSERRSQKEENGDSSDIDSKKMDSQQEDGQDDGKGSSDDGGQSSMSCTSKEADESDHCNGSDLAHNENCDVVQTSEENDSNFVTSKDEMTANKLESNIFERTDEAVGGTGKTEVKSKAKESKKKRCRISEGERTALLQDVVNGNIRPERLKERNGDIDTKYNLLMNYANLTEQQVQDVLQKLEATRNDNISPCTVCSTSSSNASQRVSPLSYYANLDTAGELPPNWQANGFQFYPELRTPRSTSSKGSTTEFTFDVNRGSCSPVDHNYANLDTLPEVQPLRHSLSGSAVSGVSSWMVLQPPPKGKMNYIQLDFDENDQPVMGSVKPLRRSLSSSASSTPPKTPVSPHQEFSIGAVAGKGDIYARIDIEKTVALANSHRQVEGDMDISTRRTRHDGWTNKAR